MAMSWHSQTLRTPRADNWAVTFVEPFPARSFSPGRGGATGWRRNRGDTGRANRVTTASAEQEGAFHLQHFWRNTNCPVLCEAKPLRSIVPRSFIDALTAQPIAEQNAVDAARLFGTRV